MDFRHSLDASICAYLLKQGYHSTASTFKQESQLVEGSDVDLEVIWRTHLKPISRSHDQTHLNQQPDAPFPSVISSMDLFNPSVLTTTYADRPISLNTLYGQGGKASSITNDELALFQKLREQNRGQNMSLSASQALWMHWQPSLGGASHGTEGGVSLLPLGNLNPSTLESMDIEQEQKRMLMLLGQKKSLLRIQKQQRVSQRDAISQAIAGSRGLDTNKSLVSNALAPLQDNPYSQQHQEHQIPRDAAPPICHQSIDKGIKPFLRTELEDQRSVPELLSNSSLKSNPKKPRKAPAKPATARPLIIMSSGLEGVKKSRRKADVPSGLIAKDLSPSFIEGPMGTSATPDLNPSCLALDLANLVKNQECLSCLLQRQVLASHPPLPYALGNSLELSSKPLMIRPEVEMASIAGLTGRIIDGSDLLDIGLGGILGGLEEVARGESPLLDLGAQIADKRFSTGGGLLLDTV